MPDATAPRPYSWLQVLIGVLTVVMLTIGTLAFRYIETRMVATAGETWPIQPPKSRTNWTDFSLNGMAMR